MRSARVPEVDAEDHVRGGAADGARESGAVVVVYGDYECPYCAKADLALAATGAARVFRHFPVPSKHPRARRLAEATEAAALQDAFWPMHDSLFADQGRLDDPHLWDRVRTLGLDLERFERDRRSPGVSARVDRDFRSGIAAGVVTTPTVFLDGEAFPGVPGEELLGRLG